jgi:hypothetical protein
MRKWVRCGLGLTNELGEVVGPPVSPDSLAWLYLRSRQDGTLPMVFYQNAPDVRQFIDWYVRGAGKEVICSTIGAWAATGELLGMGFVNAVERSDNLVKCEVGFLFTKDVSIFRQIDYMRTMVSFIFLNSDVTAVLGTTPERNPGAVAMIRRLGLRLFGPIPNYATWNNEPCGVWLSQTDKAHWFNQSQNSYLAPDPPSTNV